MIAFTGSYPKENRLFIKIGINAVCNPSKTTNCQQAPITIPPINGLTPKIPITALESSEDKMFITGPKTSHATGTVMITTNVGTKINCNTEGMIFFASFSNLDAKNAANKIGRNVFA